MRCLRTRETPSLSPILQRAFYAGHSGGRSDGATPQRRKMDLPLSMTDSDLMWVFGALVALLASLTLLPLSRSQAWYIRGLEFPRLQLITLALALLAAELLVLDNSRPLAWIIMGVTFASFVYHAWWIAPYTRFHSVEVRRADDVQHQYSLRVITANVLQTNRRADAFLELIELWKPDLVVAVETDKWWQAQLDPIERHYPYALKCPLDNLYGMLLYSRLPLTQAEVKFLVEEDKPSMHGLVTLPSGRQIRLHCLHPAPPSPTENLESSERDAELIAVGKSLARAELPVILTGDLNDVAWSTTTRLFRRVSGLLDPRIGRGIFSTFHARVPFMRWPLDHVFHSAEFGLVQIHRLPAFGSDHFALLFELALGSSEQGSNFEDEPTPTDQRRAHDRMASENVEPEDVPTPGE